MSLDEWERKVLDSDGASERVAKMIAQFFRGASELAPDELETMPDDEAVKPE